MSNFYFRNANVIKFRRLMTYINKSLLIKLCKFSKLITKVYVILAKTMSYTKSKVSDLNHPTNHACDKYYLKMNYFTSFLILSRTKSMISFPMV
jgi:hypothetical protein